LLQKVESAPIVYKNYAVRAKVTQLWQKRTYLSLATFVFDRKQKPRAVEEFRYCWSSRQQRRRQRPTAWVVLDQRNIHTDRQTYRRWFSTR